LQATGGLLGLQAGGQKDHRDDSKEKAEANAQRYIFPHSQKPLSRLLDSNPNSVNLWKQFRKLGVKPHAEYQTGTYKMRPLIGEIQEGRYSGIQNQEY
jgi:hypothetical protein